MPRPYGMIGENGTYGRGLGAVPCSDITLPAGFVGPVDCDPTNGGPVYPVGQNQISALWDAIYQYQGDVSSATPDTTGQPTPTIGSMLQQNWVPLLLGIGAVLLIRGR